jgi:hypothetical protein
MGLRIQIDDYNDAEHAGTVSWEWSQDGVPFSTLYSEPAPIDISFIYVQLFAGTPTATATPGIARLASFNAGVTPRSSSCAASTFVDTFDDSATGLEWRTFPDACCTDVEMARRPRPFHLRIREAGGMVFYEVSTNKQSWNTLQMMPAPTT